MGRKVKISELKKWDVFHWDIHDYVYIGGEDFSFVRVNIELTPNTFKYWDREEMVELLGRMEFKPEEIIAKHICDNRCLDDDNGHHCWPAL